MRKITRDSVQAFMNAIAFRSGNMQVKVLPNVTVLLVHDNEIAYRYNNPEKTLSITNCGWFSNTTKERLNAIEGVRINQVKGVWYLSGKEWDGKLIDIN